MAVKTRLKAFVFPALTRTYMLRLIVVAGTAFVVFGFILTPFRIHGHSMDPTYRDGRFNFCNKLRFVFNRPQQQDVVTIRLAGQRIMLLKRVVALEGDVVEFRTGRLFVNNQPLDEPYIRNPSAWNLPPRTVEQGHVYVVGDNRRVPMHIHQFGQTSIDRIMGGPLW